MKEHDLLVAVGGINDRYINNAIKKGAKKRKYYGWATVAAALAVVVGAGIAIKTELILQQAGRTEIREIEVTEVEKEKYVDISTLLADKGNNQESQMIVSDGIMIGNYNACYEKVNSVPSEELAGAYLENKGGAIFEDPDSVEWFRVSGHFDLQYIIRYKDGEYTLWKFLCFNESGYPYSDVLRLIYGVDSEEDIQEIISMPSSVDNTDEGKRLQSEIGVLQITDTNEIKQFYNILTKLKCSGMDSEDWERPQAMVSSPFDEVKAGRYLEIRTIEGVSIDALKYTATSGEFYEFNGIYYSVLSENDQMMMKTLLKMDYVLQMDEHIDERDSKSDQPEENKNETVGVVSVDAPVDESTYSDARTYSDEILDLQNRISAGMSNRELFFVTSSAILENPDRIHVTVNTQDKALVNKLKSYNTSGVGLEIEYVSGTAVTEEKTNETVGGVSVDVSG